MSIKNLNDIISKSLDDLDKVSETLGATPENKETLEKSEKPEEVAKSVDPKENDVEKSIKDKDVPPEEVSQDAPQDAPEDNEEGEEDSAPEEDEEGNDDVDTDDEQEQPEEDEQYEKSLEGELNSDESVKKALEVSDFLNGLVKGLTKVLDSHSSAINKSIQSTQQSQELLAKSLLGVISSQKTVLETQGELYKSIRGISKRLKAIEEQPAVRKSVSNVNVMNKSFNASLGGSDKPDAETLSKSEVLKKLTGEFTKGNVGLQQDILAFESVGDINVLSNNAKQILNLK